MTSAEALPKEDERFGQSPVSVLQKYWETSDCVSHALDRHDGGQKLPKGQDTREFHEQRWQRGCRIWEGRIYRLGKEDLSTEVERRL